MKLTNNQTEFLLQFFKDERFAGWKGIATALLETGECTVAGTDCIWKGGIGNFIEVRQAKGLISCTEYKFDLSVFLSSAWFKEYKEANLEKLFKEKTEIERKYNELKFLE